MKFFTAFTFIAVTAMVSEAKVFERCEFARELVYNQGFARETIGNWVCLAYYESSYNTGATNVNTNESIDYGIFQINDGYWCSPPSTYNDCNIACNSLIDSDISDDCNCARLIFQRHGFDAWYGWKNHCRGTDVESWVSDCF